MGEERTGAREEDTRATSPLACLLLARPFFLVPTTSKRRLSLTWGEKGFARLNGRLNTSSSVSLGLSVLSINMASFTQLSLESDPVKFSSGCKQLHYFLYIQMSLGHQEILDRSFWLLSSHLRLHNMIALLLIYLILHSSGASL